MASFSKVFQVPGRLSCHLRPQPSRKPSPCWPRTPPCAMARPSPSRRVLPFLLLLLLLLVLLHSISVYGHGGGHDDDDDADAGGAEAGPPPNLRARPLVLVKIWCLILVFAGTFAGGVSPYFFKWNEVFLVLGTQFAGGVFFGTAMMHFLSDAAEKFGDLTKKEYPFAFMLASAGYLLTMLVDCAISGVVGRQGVHGGDMGAAGARDAADGGSSQKNSSDGGYSRTHAEAEEQKLDHVNHPLENASSLGDTILLIVALCFHSVFEGIAIGVAKTKADAWRALWTVSLHKIFAAIAMGIALLRMIPDRPFLSCVVYAFAFAISSPIGVAIGIVIDATTQGHVADWIYAISMGIACGVFIYVSINHLLAKGYKSKEPLVADTPFNRWLAVVLGVAVIAVVMIWD